ncbi:MAG: hypothetical protein ABIM21_06795 [candidate division WOR-3 bacterium]
MKKLGWVFFILLIFLSLSFIRFYFFTYSPLKSENEFLKAENTLLKDSLLRVLVTREMPREEKIKVVKEIKYNVADFFVGNGVELTDKGKEALKGLKESVAPINYDSLIIILYPEKGNLSANRALKIKSYLVSLGLDKEKVWGRVSNDVERGKVVVRVK